MNIIICGNQCGLCEQLSERLAREKNEVYYISGNNADGMLSKSVFQEYHFTYLNDNIYQIVSGVGADMMILCGAYDTNFMWRNGEREANHYITSMTSLCMAAKSCGIKRLIYLSSTEVYETNTEREINSDTVPTAESIKNRTLYRAENLIKEICGNEENGIDLTILRLAPVFGDFQRNSDNLCLRMTLDYLEKDKINIFGNLTHTGLFYKDAVEAVFQCVRREPRSLKTLYNIKGLVFTDEEFAEALIETGWNKKAQIIHTPVENLSGYRQLNYPPKDILDDARDGLGLNYRYDLARSADQICKSCLKKRQEVREAKHRELKILPIIESIVLAAIAYIATVWLRGTWVGDTVNLFVIYVLFLAVSYGISHALLASLFGGIGLLFIMMADASFVEVISNYVFFLGFLQLVVVGVIAGCVRDKFKKKNNNLTEENEYLANELEDITRINDNNVYVKDIYSKRLIGYENSLSRIYELTTQLNYMESQKVTFQAVHMICELMEMSDVAIYTASSRSCFLRLSAATSDLASSCGKSLKFDETSFLYEDLIKHNVYSNREFGPKNPTFASAVFSKDRLLSIILVWTDDIHKVNLYESDMLAIASRLIEESMSRSFLYEESLRDDTHFEGTNIMKADAFMKTMDIYEDGLEQGLLQYTTLKIGLNGHEYAEASRMVRDTDWVGIVNENLYIILSNSNIDDAQFVIKRFVSKDMTADPVETKYVIGEFKAQALAAGVEQ